MLRRRATGTKLTCDSKDGSVVKRGRYKAGEEYKGEVMVRRAQREVSAAARPGEAERRPTFAA
jgi:hypothetical protein